MTTIVISHRESTISKCDNVYFMSAGKASENGCHSTLLKKSEAYRAFWEGEYGNS